MNGFRCPTGRRNTGNSKGRKRRWLWGQEEVLGDRTGGAGDIWGLCFGFTPGWGRLQGGQGGVGSLLQEAGDVIPAAGGPHERVCLHGDVSSHQLGRLLPPRATAVAHPVVVHAEPGTTRARREEISRALGHPREGVCSPCWQEEPPGGAALTCGRSRGRW